MTHLLTCSLCGPGGGGTNGLGTALAWIIGVPACLAGLVGVIRLLNGNPGRRR